MSIKLGTELGQSAGGGSIDMSQYRKKAELITITEENVVLNIFANKNYVFSNANISSITLTGCESSREETTIEFSTGANIPELNVVGAGINWKEELQLKANKSYLIVIFNKWAFVEER